MNIGTLVLPLRDWLPSRLIGRLHMVNQTLPKDFKEFLKLLNVHDVEYLLIGGYAVGYYGYPRTTADIDVWIAININNAQKLINVFSDFGMISSDIKVSHQILRLSISILK